jgi:ribosomal protein L37AE/L43A
VAPPQKGTLCPSCESDNIVRTTRGKLRCNVCRIEWR